ncbi:hypothetical protein QBC39DRAFT_34832 [Podospora conica]|nr:hypothetical protein QBC39DRAFT_34832 [Schizothecium conicum]
MVGFRVQGCRRPWFFENAGERDQSAPPSGTVHQKDTGRQAASSARQPVSPWRLTPANFTALSIPSSHCFRMTAFRPGGDMGIRDHGATDTAAPPRIFHFLRPLLAEPGFPTCHRLECPGWTPLGTVTDELLDTAPRSLKFDMELSSSLELNRWTESCQLGSHLLPHRPLRWRRKSTTKSVQLSGQLHSAIQQVTHHGDTQC